MAAPAAPSTYEDGKPFSFLGVIMNFLRGGKTVEDLPTRQMIVNSGRLHWNDAEKRLLVREERHINDIGVCSELADDANVTSVAQWTWTVPDDEVWILVAVTGRNVTDAAQWILGITPSGGAAVWVNEMENTGTLNVYYNLLESVMGRNLLITGGLRSRIMPPGTVITLLDETFTAADTIKHHILYYKVTA